MADDRYKEDQESEIEALQSIYVDEIIVLSEDPYTFTIPIKFCSEENGEELTAETCLQFTFTKTYPDELPIIETQGGNITENDEEELISFLKEEAESNIGMPMVFTLVSVAQEHLEKVIERIKKEKEEIERIKELEIKKEEEKKYHGTHVTVESFTKWRIEFENEINERTGKKNKEDVDSKKLTGRQLFERDSTLQFSDAQFYSEGSAGVQVDESLFQELDDLELEDDDED